MTRHLVRLAVPALALVIGLALRPAAAVEIPMLAHLDAAHVTPATGSPATGEGTFVLDTVANTLAFTITVAGLTAAETEAHIRVPAAPVGAGGGAAFPLPAGSPKVGVWQFDESLEMAILKGLAAVDVRTGAFPGGEIAGPIVVDSVCTFDTNGDGIPNLLAPDDDGDGLCEFPPRRTALPGTLRIRPRSPIEFVSRTVVEADAIVAEAGSLLAADAAAVSQLTLEAAEGNLTLGGMLDLAVDDDLVIEARKGHVTVAGSAVVLAAADRLAISARRGNVTIAPVTAPAADAFTALAGRVLSVHATGPAGSLRISRAHLGSRRIEISTRTSASLVGTKQLHLTEGAVLTTDLTRTGVDRSSSGNVRVQATGPIIVSGDVELDSGRHLLLTTRSDGDDLCLLDDTLLRARDARGRAGRVDVRGVSGRAVSDGTLEIDGSLRGTIDDGGACGPLAVPSPTPVVVATPRPPGPVTLQRITLAPAARQLSTGEVQRFTATGHLSDGSTTNLTQALDYASSDPGVAEALNLDGDRSAVRGVGTGTATISATDPATGISTSASGGDARLTVVGVLVRLALSPATRTLAIGDEQRYTVTGFFDGGGARNLTQDVVYSSSDEGIVRTPNAEGDRSRVEAVGPGTATIVATDPATGVSTTDSGESAEITVLGPLVRITLTPPTATKPVGESQRYTATGHFADGSSRSITQSVIYTTSDPAVAVAPNTAGDRSFIQVVGPGTTLVIATDPATGVSTSDSGDDAVIEAFVAPVPPETWRFYARVVRTNGSGTNVHVPRRSVDRPIEQRIRNQHRDAFDPGDRVFEAEIAALGFDTLERLARAIEDYVLSHPDDYPNIAAVDRLIWAQRQAP